MSERCFTMAELHEIAELPGDDPRLAHVDDCPRCSALLACYRDFLSQGASVPPAEMDRFRREFSEALEAQSRVAIGDRLRRAFRGLTQPVLRPAWAMIAVALIVIAVQHARHTNPVYRGESPMGSALITSAPTMRNDGRLLLTWTPHPEADGYAVIFLTAQAVEVARMDASVRCAVAVAPDSLRNLAGGSGHLIWQVSAIKRRDVVASSDPRTLDLGGL